MASPLILLVTFFIVAAAQLADANKCEGTYTFNKEAILEGIYSDIECKGFIKKTQKAAKEIINNGKLLEAICESASRERKLSICMKTLQQRLKPFKPLSFTIDPNESDLICRRKKFWSRNEACLSQEMYVCPKTKVQYARGAAPNEEPQFLVGQGMHTHYRVRIFEFNRTSQERLASIQGQLDGFNYEKDLKYERVSGGLYKYKLDYGSSQRLELVGEFMNFSDYANERANNIGIVREDVE